MLLFHLEEKTPTEYVILELHYDNPHEIIEVK